MGLGRLQGGTGRADQPGRVGAVGGSSPARLPPSSASCAAAAAPRSFLRVPEALGLGGEGDVLARLRVDPLDVGEAEAQQLGLLGPLARAGW